MISIGPLLLVVIGLGFVIFVHELGHFLLAKWAGVRVEVFSLGFGNALFHFKRGDTDYRISAIPLGGYVKMAGESREEGGPPKPGELMAQPVWKRALIFVAGVTMNFITAFIMFIIAFRIGVHFPAAVVGDIEVGSPAWIAGLEPGDRIVEINGSPDTDFEELLMASALSRDSEVSLVVERDGQRKTYQVKPEYEPVQGVRLLGIIRPATLQVGGLLAYGTEKDSPALKAGIQVGDRLVAVNGVKLKNWSEFRALCLASPGKAMSVALERRGKELTVTLTPRSVVPYQIGVSEPSTVVRDVRHESLAERLGFRKGDKIVSVNEKPVQSWVGFVEAMKDVKKGRIRIGIQGRGLIALDAATEKDELLEGIVAQHSLPHTPSVPATVSEARGLADRMVRFFAMLRMRVASWFPQKARSDLVIAAVVEGMPAAQAGLKPGDVLKLLNGKRVRSWEELVTLVDGSKGKPITLVWRHDGKKFAPVTLQAVLNEKAAVGEVGVVPVEDRVLRKYGFWKSCTVGTHKALLTVVQIYNTLAGIFSGRISPRNVGSIILIAQATYYSALEGVGKLLYFLGILGINFAILNALPIPVLDGGHLLFLVFEKIKGSPLKERTMAIAQYAGLILLLGLVLYAVRNDILRLLGSP